MTRLIPILAVTAAAAFIPTLGDAAIATGRLNVTVTITIVTPIPSGDEVACDATATGGDSSTSHTEVAFMLATQISPSPLTYQCVFSIPYEWQLTTPTTVSVIIHGGAGYLPSGSTSLTGLIRSSDHTFTAEYNLSTSPTPISQIIDLRL